MATGRRLGRAATWVGLLASFLLLSAIVGVQAQSEDGETFQNPVFENNFPDPFILQAGDVYYAYSTNSNSRNVPIATSTDLVTWTMGRDVMSGLARWVRLSGPDVWAPE